MLQAHDLLDGLDLSVGCNLGSTGIPDVQQFAPEPQPNQIQKSCRPETVLAGQAREAVLCTHALYNFVDRGEM